MHNKAANPLKESFLIIKSSKKIFSLILLLQIIFFLSVITANSIYLTKILQSTMNIVEYSENLNLDPRMAALDNLQQNNPLGPDPLLVSRNYDEIARNFTFLLSFILVFYVLVNGSAWYFASNVKEKKLFSLKIASYLLRFFFVSLLLSFFVYFLMFNIVKIVFSGYLLTQPVNFIPLLIVSIVAIYFTFIPIPLLGKFRNKDLKKTVKKIFLIGTKNFKEILFSYIIILTAISLSSLLMFYFIELNLFLLFLSVVLFLLVFAWSKVYFSLVVKRLSGF